MGERGRRADKRGLNIEIKGRRRRGMTGNEWQMEGGEAKGVEGSEGSERKEKGRE